MDLLSYIPDNITEVLVKILQFTDLRRGILNGNIRGMDMPGYIPRDLPMVEFAELLQAAISEHLQHHRLLFRDTTNITFGDGGTMRIHPVADDHGAALLKTDPDEYLNLQINRLVENFLNGKVAQELIERHSGITCCLPDVDSGKAVTTDVFPKDLPSRPATAD
jgi:hypothetical protein